MKRQKRHISCSRLDLGLILQYFAQHSFANVCAVGQGWEGDYFWEEGGIVYSVAKWCMDLALTGWS